MSESNSKVIPTPEAISEASKLEVLDLNGEKLLFGSLFKPSPITGHFFCGRCQEYVMQLASIAPAALSQAKTKIVVIGCGGWEPIKNYLELTDFQGQIFADPSRKLYHTLGMTIESLQNTPAGVEKKSYLKTGTLSNALTSIWTGPLKHPTLMGKQGNISQLGGDFIFGPGEICSYASRMQHTQDHIEVADLMEAAGVAYP